MNEATPACQLVPWQRPFLDGEERPTGPGFEQALSDVASLGFEGFESFSEVAMSDAEEARLRSLVEASELSTCAMYFRGRWSDPADEERILDQGKRVATVLRDLGAPHLVLGPALGYRSAPAGSDEPGLRRAAETMARLGEIANQLGVKASIHPHVDSEVFSREEIDLVLGHADQADLGLCVDTAQQAAAGIDLIEFLGSYSGRVSYVHLKDIDLDPGSSVGDEDDWASQFMPLGRGSIDFPAVTAKLGEIGYGGWVTAEIDLADGSPLDPVRECRDYMRDVLGVAFPRASNQSETSP